MYGSQKKKQLLTENLSKSYTASTSVFPPISAYGTLNVNVSLNTFLSEQRCTLYIWIEREFKPQSITFLDLGFSSGPLFRISFFCRALAGDFALCCVTETVKENLFPPFYFVINGTFLFSLMSLLFNQVDLANLLPPMYSILNQFR